MVPSIVTKMSLTKSGAVMGVTSADMVVSYTASGVTTYSIDSIGTNDNTVCYFTDVQVSDPTDYADLYAIANALDPVRFP